MIPEYFQMQGQHMSHIWTISARCRRWAECTFTHDIMNQISIELMRRCWPTSCHECVNHTYKKTRRRATKHVSIHKVVKVKVFIQYKINNIGCFLFFVIISSRCERSGQPRHQKNWLRVPSLLIRTTKPRFLTGRLKPLQRIPNYMVLFGGKSERGYTSSTTGGFRRFEKICLCSLLVRIMNDVLFLLVLFSNVIF